MRWEVRPGVRACGGWGDKKLKAPRAAFFLFVDKRVCKL